MKVGGDDMGDIIHEIANIDDLTHDTLCWYVARLYRMGSRHAMANMIMNDPTVSPHAAWMRTRANDDQVYPMMPPAHWLLHRIRPALAEMCLPTAQTRGMSTSIRHDGNVYVVHIRCPLTPVSPTKDSSLPRVRLTGRTLNEVYAKATLMDTVHTPMIGAVRQADSIALVNKDGHTIITVME